MKHAETRYLVSLPTAAVRAFSVLGAARWRPSDHRFRSILMTTDAGLSQ